MKLRGAHRSLVCRVDMPAAVLTTMVIPTEDIDHFVKLTGVTGAGVLLLNVVALMRGWMVPWWVHKREIERADRYESRAWDFHQTTKETLNVAKESVVLAEKVVSKKEAKQ